jgi:predicted RND superfamily exporter protein
MMDDRSEETQSTSRLAAIRDPIERGFGRFGHWIYRRAGYTIVVVLLAVAGLCSQLPKLEMDTSTEGMFPIDDQVRIAYDDFRDRYGRDQAILMAIQTDDVFDIGFLEKLRALHEDLEAELPHLQDVESLVNIRSTRGEGDELVVDDLLEEWPESEADLERLRDHVHSTPLYLDQVISRDDRITTVIIRPNVYTSEGSSVDLMGGFDGEVAGEGEERERVPFLTGEENTEIVRAAEAVAARYRADDFRILTAGVPIITDQFMREMSEDMAFFTGLALLTIAVFLALVFRRFGGVILPLIVSTLAMLCTMGVRVLLDTPITSLTQITPSFLLAIGVGSAVHILSIYYQATARGESREDAIAHSLEHSGLPVVMTSLTTAGGLASFASADLQPLVDLGVITPIGILMALVFSLVLLPALIAFMPIKGGGHEQVEIVGTRRVLMAIGDWAVRHAVAVVAIWGALLLFSLAGAMRLSVSHDPIKWFPPEHPLRVAMETLDVELNGTMFVEGIVTTGVDDRIQSPELLGLIEEIERFAVSQSDVGIRVGKTISITNVVKETHRALNENRPEFYAIPDDPRLVAQELLLFENAGSDDLERIVDSGFSEARITLKLPFADGTIYEPFLQRLEEGAREILGDEGEITFTGEMRMIARISGILISNVLRTYAIAILIITPLMMLLLGSFRVGLMSMIPNLAPIVITLGIMGWCGIPLELFTLLIGSIALGLAVDDTVHFMHNFRRYFERSGDVAYATRETLSTTGQALLFTSIVLSSGFFIYTFATMANLFYFGLLTGITILLAFLADLILAPALMALLAGRMMKWSGQPSVEGGGVGERPEPLRARVDEPAARLRE